MQHRVLGIWLLVVFLIGAIAWGQHPVINELAWAGTEASPSDEWIELYNPSDSPIDLTGWTLTFGKTVIDLGSGTNTVIPAGGYFLLERSDDNTISDIAADLIYTGSLSNSGTVIELHNPAGEIVDTANSGCEDGWYAGAAAGSYSTMERVDPLGPDAPANWRTNDGVHRVGLDADGNPINGTPKAKNSATIAYETIPRVEVAGPEQGEVVSGVYLVGWTAHDPDGDDTALKIDLYYSSDNGENWTLIASGLANSGSYPWDTTGLESGDRYVLKVVATDPDALAGEGISSSFTVSNPG